MATTAAPGDGAAPAGQAAEPKPTASAADDRRPSFDIIRVEPTGESVIAARGAPGAEIELLDGTTTIAHARTDASGQVAFLPPALKPGEHSLMLRVTGPDGTQTASSQSVAVSIPAEPRTAPMVALIQPNQPAAILSGPVAGSGPAVPPAVPTPPAGISGAPDQQTAATKPAAPSEPVAIRSVEVESMGSFYATGRAPPGSKSRIYLNDAYVATVTAGPGGAWSLRINRGMKPGRYAVRADQVEPSGKVVARAQVPFDYPAQVASTASGMDAAKKKSDTASSQAASPGGSGTASETAQVGTFGAGSARPAGGASSGPEAAPVGGTGPSAASADVGGGHAAPGPAVAALGGTDRARPTASPQPAAAGVPAPVGTPLPMVTRPEAAAPSGSQAALPPRGAKPDRTTPGPTPDMASGTAAGSAPPEPDSRAGAGTGGPSPGPTTTADAEAVLPSREANPGQETPDGAPGAASRVESGSAVHQPNRQADARVDGASPNKTATAATADDSPTIVEELVTAKVVRGDSLWRISRQMLGHGIRYTQIYAANTQQIRDPRLIFPGQVFVLPEE